MPSAVEKKAIEEAMEELRSATIANLSIKVDSEEWISTCNKLSEMRRSLKIKQVKFKAFTTFSPNRKYQERSKDDR